MTSWLLLAEAGVPEGGLFDLDATLPLMAIQVVFLTFILNAIFFRPIGRTVEERENYVASSRADAKQKLAQVERLEANLTEQLRGARKQSQTVIAEAEEEVNRLYQEALRMAQAEANNIRESSRREIEIQKAAAIKSLQGDVDRLSNLIVDRLLASR
uniref:ATP synthase subunit b', organellar chromatophore n=1 Tax=Paulinella chromatophora TaxID=39717 RepID=ATPF2_PAUCH|nr:ATP synthase subunit B' [Paulinella chromatophora]B1X3Y3.1 RecName: Full=ATP synthase subunit b', organellar chromatophore; AltName: Full=ATP synthase F(0) sector subunit b'; AltName: Full=ATPase subunit II [Paulinella chromatophora]ACB42652.1 ATP synthase subunit B' [Paulinella chromatophora]